MYKSTLAALLRADIICDITGGDSFSDIYGMRRLVMGSLLKRICQMTGKPFIMLPQTYGPYKSTAARWMAKEILNNAHSIYSRDREGIVSVEKLIGKSGIVRLCPDVAFILEPACRIKTDERDGKLETLVQSISRLKNENCQLVGINVSGLLYSGGYTRDNQFGLRSDYAALIGSIIEYFQSMDHIRILLVPHVYNQVSPETLSDFPGENDLAASYLILRALPREIRKEILILETKVDQCEIKYLIGHCEFFIGSRMHATIASLSQYIPTVALGYSKKFIGVYETAGAEDCVADLRNMDNREVLEKVHDIYNHRAEIHDRLKTTIPGVKKQVYQVFENLEF